MKNFRVTALGQVGYVFDILGKRIVIDPYLSNYVEDLHGSLFARELKVPFEYGAIRDIDLLLISHEHEDHCDPNSIHGLLEFSPNMKLVCPKECNRIISNLPIKEVVNLKINETIKLDEIEIAVTPASHPTLEIKDEYSKFQGFLIAFDEYIIYHAGDTIPFEYEKFPSKIDLAFLPINERNYFRETNGIIGNMTCREAIDWSTELNIKKWIPTHWDMFGDNSTYKEELDFLAKKNGVETHIWLDAGLSLEFEYAGKQV